MGNAETKIKEIVTATANAPSAINISAELFILICIITTLVVIVKYLKVEIKKKQIEANNKNLYTQGVKRTTNKCHRK